MEVVGFEGVDLHLDEPAVVATNRGARESVAFPGWGGRSYSRTCSAVRATRSAWSQHAVPEGSRSPAKSNTAARPADSHDPNSALRAFQVPTADRPHNDSRASPTASSATVTNGRGSPIFTAVLPTAMA
ncbi:hypothetical protein [Saccharopolyspora pogona]|uniref:hypothetical protein n=1 Tax=Saccharopolyspora pogona TaxID=333966 RepID=UPI001686AC90|nr:hypothetical protein [Saccharopolyspora pogona]